MTTLTEGAVFDALRTVQEPELGRDIVTLNMVKGIAIEGSDVAFTIELTTPACPLKDEIERNARAALAGIGAAGIEITWGAMVRRAAPAAGPQLLEGVKNIIAVASGKGGVGKTTVSTNLAVALARDGAAVGLLDADITGPNNPLMMGIEGAPKASPDNKIVPLERHGVKVDLDRLLRPRRPAHRVARPARRRRDPAVPPAIVAWGDPRLPRGRPPAGTSDAQLTLGPVRFPSRAPCWYDAPGGGARGRREGPGDVPPDERPGHRRGREHECLRLPPLRRGDRDLGRGGAERFAREHDLEFLGGIPLDVTVRQGGDAGIPVVAQREPGPAAQALTAMARTVAARMSVRAARQQPS